MKYNHKKTSVHRLVILAAMTAFISMSASAACGGGGWKKSTSDGKQLPAPPVAYADNSLDTQAFNKISGELSLSLEQANSIIAEFNNIRAAIDALKKAQYDAHADYVACKEKAECESRLQKFKDAVAAVKNYATQQELEARLTKILRPEQVEKYNTARQLAKK